MKTLLALTLFGLLAINCSCSYRVNAPSSRGSTMTNSVGAQAELDAANQRINEFKQELLRQGFHEVSVSFHDTTTSTDWTNSKEQFVLEGRYGTLKDLRVTLWSTKRLQKEQPQLGGGVKASLPDQQAERDFDELYQKVAFAVTGHSQ